MGAILLDTHAWAWTLTDDDRLSAVARAALAEAEAVHVSPISFFEIGQKVRIGKWPEMAPFLAGLPALLVEQGGFVATLTPEICLLAAAMDWPHRDPFDRLIAATCIRNELILLSADGVFDGFSGPALALRRLW